MTGRKDLSSSCSQALEDGGRVPGLPPLAAVIQRYDLQARKGLGQHFLLDPGITRRVVEASAPLTGRTVIEVGPGPGGLTRALLAGDCGHVYAVELDRRCQAALAELADAYPGRLTVIEGDALASSTWELGTPPRKVVSNLPYNVGTALLIGWLKALAADPGCLESLTLMFQKEVAARLSARPRTEAYGRLSVLSQWLCRVETCFDLPPGAFRPAPKVVSSVVRLTPRAEPLAPAKLVFVERVTEAAFGQRRKMLRQSLKRLGRDPRPLLEEAGLAETARAEELPVEAFCHLARLLERAEADLPAAPGRPKIV